MSTKKRPKAVPVREAIQELEAQPTPAPEATAVIRLQFVLGADLLSRAIAWYGQGANGFSHVDILLADDRCLGARADRIRRLPDGKHVNLPPGVRIRPPNYERWVRREVVEIALPQSRYVQAMDFAMHQRGDAYDGKAILGFLTGHFEHARRHFICSAFACDILSHGAVMPPLPVPYSEITPNSLRLLAYARGGVRQSDTSFDLRIHSST